MGKPRLVALQKALGMQISNDKKMLRLAYDPLLGCLELTTYFTSRPIPLTKLLVVLSGLFIS